MIPGRAGNVLAVIAGAALALIIVLTLAQPAL